MAKPVSQTQPLICHGHTRPIVELSFSPQTPDGYFLVSASKDGAPMLRNGATGDWIGTFQGHKGAVWSCALNEAALLAATGSADFSARLWDAVTGDEKHVFPHKHIVRSVAFSRDQRQLITAGHEKVLRLFELERPEAEPQMLEGAPGPIRAVVPHVEERLVWTTYVDKPNADLWDVREGRVVRSLDAGGTVLSLEAPWEDSKLLTTAQGESVVLWDASSFKQVSSFDLGYPVESASLCASKQCFAAGGADMWAHLYESDTGKELQCNKGHHGPVHCVRFAPGGVSYASGSEDGTIRIWDTVYPPASADQSTPPRPQPPA